MKKTFAILITIVFFAAQNQAFAYKDPDSISVALVPYDEEPSVELSNLITQIAEKLETGRSMRVLEQDKTNAIVDYYITHIAKTSVEKDADRQLTSAREALLDGDYNIASKLLGEAEQMIKERVAKGGSNEGLQEVYLLNAKIHYARGNETELQKEYDKVVLLNPDLEFDEKLYPKWEREALASSKTRIQAERRGSIKVISDPEGSEVFLNGIQRGITPLTVEKLPPATHCVEVKTVNHQPFCKCVSLGRGETVTLNPALSRVNLSTLHGKGQTIRPSIYKTDLEKSRMVSTLGYHLGVDKIILVSQQKGEEGETVTYRVGNTDLGAVLPTHRVMMDLKKPEHNVTLLTNELHGEVKADIMANPGKFANRSVGSLQLHEKKTKPFYRQPLFWILLVTGAAAGGTLGAAMINSSNEPTTGGITIEL